MEDADKAWNSPISISEVNHAIKRSKGNSAAGPDGITNAVYKTFSEFSVFVLCYLFNLFFMNGFVPFKAMSGIVMAVAKAAGGFRPITCLCNLMKLLEMIILKRIGPQLDDHLPSYQFGFRPEIGAEDQLLNFVNHLQGGGEGLQS